jgi:hypothetical protein
MSADPTPEAVTFPIRIDRWFAWLLPVALATRRTTRMTVDDREVDVRMGASFATTIPRSHVVDAWEPDLRPISRGVHGWGGRWLVNGSGRGLVRLRIDPPVRARVLGVPVRLTELTMSLEMPAAAIAALAPTGVAGRPGVAPPDTP